MTVKELYDWAKAHDALDLELNVQYRDSGGGYSGYDSYIEPEIERAEYNRDVKIVVI